MPLRRSSWCRRPYSGCTWSRGRSGATSRRRSNAASSTLRTVAQSSPAVAARPTYLVTTPLEIPSAAAICWCDILASSFKRNTSFILRILILGTGTLSPDKCWERTRSVAICVTSFRCCTTPFRYRDRRFRHRDRRFRWRPKSVTIDRNGWSRWTGMTGHDRPESLVTIDRNTHVHRQMHLAPGAALGITVLAHLPFAFAKHLQTGAVDHQMQRFAATQGRQHDVEIPGAAAQRRVVGHRQIGEGELVHARRETLQRAQWQAKHLLESEQHLDDRVGVDAWPATFGSPGFSVPLPQVLLHPDRNVTSRDQPGIVGRPVFNPVLALGFLPLLFVLVHRFRQKARIYASSSKVNSPAAPAVARKRQPWLPQDLCNNAPMVALPSILGSVPEFNLARRDLCKARLR